MIQRKHYCCQPGNLCVARQKPWEPMSSTPSVHLQSVMASMKSTNQTSKSFSLLFPENFSTRFCNSLKPGGHLKLGTLLSFWLLSLSSSSKGTNCCSDGLSVGDGCSDYCDIPLFFPSSFPCKLKFCFSNNSCILSFSVLVSSSSPCNWSNIFSFSCSNGSLQCNCSFRTLLHTISLLQDLGYVILNILPIGHYIVTDIVEYIILLKAYQVLSCMKDVPITHTTLTVELGPRFWHYSYN